MSNQDSVEWDSKINGLGLRTRDKSKTWFFRYRFGKTQRRVNLGRHPALTLVAARRAAERLAAEIALGKDPAAERQAARVEAENTFEVLAAQYLEARKPHWRPTSYGDIARHLNKYARPLHGSPITSVSQRSIANLLNAIAKESGDTTANRVRASLSALFGWTMREGIRLPEGNVAAYTNKREEKSRERVLTNAELKAIWAACDGERSDFGPVVRLLLLTGQRRKEIGLLRWDEVHDEQIILPGSRTKNKRSHVIPLSEPAKAIIAGLEAGRTYVFGRDDTGFQGWGLAKRALDARLSDVSEWTLHDLRRTVATRMAELGVQPHIIEAVLNHVSGHKGGVAGIYNRATYDREKREALNLWAEHVTALVEGRKAVVVPMRRT
jgi:integrase